MEKLENKKVKFKDLQAEVTLTRDTADSGLAHYEVILNMTTRVPDRDGLIEKVLRDQEIIKEITGGSQTSTIKRESRAGDSAARLSYATVTIIPEPIGDYEGDANRAFNRIAMVLQCLEHDSE